MKGCIPKADPQLQGWQTTLFTNFLVLTAGLRYCLKKENIKIKDR